MILLFDLQSRDPSQVSSFPISFARFKTKAQAFLWATCPSLSKNLQPKFPANQRERLLTRRHIPEYYDCGQLTAAFLDKYKNSPIRGACSGNHCWIKPLIGTVDLGEGGIIPKLIWIPHQGTRKEPIFCRNNGRLPKFYMNKEKHGPWF